MFAHNNNGVLILNVIKHFIYYNPLFIVTVGLILCKFLLFKYLDVS